MTNWYITTPKTQTTIPPLPTEPPYYEPPAGAVCEQCKFSQALQVEFGTLGSVKVWVCLWHVWEHELMSVEQIEPEDEACDMYEEHV